MTSLKQPRQLSWFNLNQVGIAGYLLLVFGPVLFLFLNSFYALFTGGGEWLDVLIPNGQRLILLLRSLGLSTAVALGGTFLGFLGGLYLQEKSSRVQQIFHLVLVLIATIPPYVHALAWNNIVDKINSLLPRYGFSILSLRGWGAGWWVWMMALTPLSISLLLLGLNSIDHNLIEAARIHQGDFKILRRIIVPLVQPYLAVSAGILFLTSLVDFSIPALFQTTNYSLSLFADFSANHQPWRVFLLTFPLLLVGLIVLYLMHRSLQKTPLNPLWRRKKLVTAYQWPGWLVWAQTITIGILLILFLVPLYSLVSLNSSWADTLSHIADAAGDIKSTLSTSLLAAICSTPFAYALARKIHTSQSQKLLGWLLVSAPINIPPSLTGIGLISIWNHSFLPGVYNTEIMPVLASIARFSPFASLIFLAQLRTLKPELLEAAEILQASKLKKWIWIKMPLTAPAWIAAGLIVFIFSLGELGATLLVVPAGTSTLTIRIFNYLHYGASETVASLVLIVTLLSLLAGLIVILIFWGWSKFIGINNQS